MNDTAELPHTTRKGLVYAVVRFEGSDRGRAVGVVVAFETPAVADAFAREAGLDRYQVVPIGFHVAHPAHPDGRL